MKSMLRLLLGLCLGAMAGLVLGVLLAFLLEWLADVTGRAPQGDTEYAWMFVAVDLTMWFALTLAGAVIGAWLAVRSRRTGAG